MGGNYADVPSWRMAWDRDGTQAFTLFSGYTAVGVQLSQANMAAMNGEGGGYSQSSPSGNSHAFGLIFPEPRDLDATFFRGNGSDGVGSAQVSTNTTNLIDGTWSTYAMALGTNLRNDIQSNTALGVKALRLPLWQSGGRLLHLFGERSAGGPNTQRLELWHPTLDQRVGQAYFDWDDVPRGTTDTRDFRVKNLHSSLTAHAVRVAMEALTDTTPSTVGQQQITKDGGASWGSQQTIGDLGPGAISSVLTIRRQTLTTAALSLWWNRIFAETTTGWS